MPLQDDKISLIIVPVMNSFYKIFSHIELHLKSLITNNKILPLTHQICTLV